MISSKRKIGGAKPIQLDTFDLNNMPPYKMILLVAKRHSGKSTLIENLMYRFRDAPICMGFSATEKYNHFYSKHVDPRLIHEDYDPDVIENIKSRQEKILDYNAKKASDAPICDPHMLVIFDDMMADAGKMFKDAGMKFMIFNGRHIKLTTILATQYIMLIPTNCRSNLDYIVLFQETNVTVQRKIYALFGENLFSTFNEFKATMDFYTQDYGCLIIDNTTKTNDLRKQLYYFKAVVDLPEFRIPKKRSSR